MDRELIDQYENGGTKLKQSIVGLLPEDLNVYPVPGTWSIRQIVAHLVDADLVYGDRIKRVICDDAPTLLAYDENKWATGLQYEMQPTEIGVELFDLNRKHVAATLRLLEDDAFARTGHHTERGPMTLAELIESAVKHLEHHVKFVYDKREKLGKLMW